MPPSSSVRYLSISRPDLLEFVFAAEVVRVAREEPNLLHVVLDTPPIREATLQRTPAYLLRDASTFQLPGTQHWWPGATSAPSADDGDIWRRHLVAQIRGDLGTTRALLDDALTHVASVAPCRPLALISELWSRYWIFDEALAGALALGCTPPELRVTEAVAVVKAQKDHLRCVQQQATTALEWATACFHALPLLAFAQAVLDDTSHVDARPYARVADEMRVDLRHSLYAVAASALVSGRPVFANVRTTRDSASIAHLSRSRFSLPVRWAEMRGPATALEAIRLLAMLVVVIHRAGWQDMDPRFAATEVGIVTDSSPILSGWRIAPLYTQHRADSLPGGLEGVTVERRKTQTTTYAPSDRRRRSRNSPIRDAARALDAEEATVAGDRMPIRFVAQLLSAHTWKAVAPRHLTHDAWEVTQSLTGLGRERVLAMWIVDLSAPQPTCDHPECAFGQLFLGPRARRRVTTRSLVEAVAVEVVDWLTQPRPYPVVFDVRDVIVEVENKRGRLRTRALDLRSPEAPRWVVPDACPDRIH
jgi:hypothetical protein